MQQHKNSGRVLNLLLCAAMLAGGWWVFTHHQDIVDWWRLRNYQAPAAIVQLTDQTTMSARARDMLYVSEPQIEDRAAFNQHCQTTAEQGKVLGCYAAQHIYLFNVTDQRLSGVLQVTAAHETLHAIYERLDTPTKNHVNSLVRAQADSLKDDKKLQDVLAIYMKTEPGELDNELHSILGTEYSNLNPDLEAYYKQYFTDRGKIVAFQKAYNTEFDASKTRIADYQKQLDALKRQIDINTAELERRSGELTAERTRMDALRNTDPAAYNQQVPAFNSSVQAYNQVARQTQNLVNNYNGIVANIKNEIALQNDLNHSLDSKYQPVQTQ